MWGALVPPAETSARRSRAQRGGGAAKGRARRGRFGHRLRARVTQICSQNRKKLKCRRELPRGKGSPGRGCTPALRSWGARLGRGSAQQRRGSSCVVGWAAPVRSEGVISNVSPLLYFPRLGQARGLWLRAGGAERREVCPLLRRRRCFAACRCRCLSQRQASPIYGDTRR